MQLKLTLNLVCSCRWPWTLGPSVSIFHNLGFFICLFFVLNKVLPPSSSPPASVLREMGFQVYISPGRELLSIFAVLGRLRSLWNDTSKALRVYLCGLWFSPLRTLLRREANRKLSTNGRRILPSRWQMWGLCSAECSVATWNRTWAMEHARGVALGGRELCQALGSYCHLTLAESVGIPSPSKSPGAPYLWNS